MVNFKNKHKQECAEILQLDGIQLDERLLFFLIFVSLTHFLHVLAFTEESAYWTQHSRTYIYAEYSQQRILPNIPTLVTVLCSMQQSSGKHRWTTLATPSLVTCILYTRSAETLPSPHGYSSTPLKHTADSVSFLSSGLVVWRFVSSYQALLPFRVFLHSSVPVSHQKMPDQFFTGQRTSCRISSFHRSDNWRTS